MRVVNGASVATNTTISIDYLRALNYNELEVRNHVVGEASSSQVVGFDGDNSRLIYANKDGALAVEIGSDPGLALLRRLVKALDSLQVVDSQQRQKVTIDAGTLPTVSTITNPVPLGNLATIAGVDPRYAMIDAARNAYGNGIRANLIW
jgi:hypothetical protein